MEYVDIIIVVLIIVGIVLAVHRRKKKQAVQKPQGSPVADTSTAGGQSGAGISDTAAPKGGSVAGFDDSSAFRFGSDDDFAAALGALTGEKPVSTPKPVALEEEGASQGFSGNASFTGAGVVRCKINGEYDRPGTSARFENGKIYGLSNQGEYLIGSYDPEVTEVRNTRDEIIGRIDGNLIILTREGQVERLKAQGRDKTPDELVLLCAERFSNRICSTENSEELALCSSDDRACAAAFICLHYDGDGIGPKESELHRFWYSWM